MVCEMEEHSSRDTQNMSTDLTTEIGVLAANINLLKARRWFIDFCCADRDGRGSSICGGEGL